MKQFSQNQIEHKLLILDTSDSDNESANQESLDEENESKNDFNKEEIRKDEEIIIQNININQILIKLILKLLIMIQILSKEVVINIFLLFILIALKCIYNFLKLTLNPLFEKHDQTLLEDEELKVGEKKVIFDYLIKINQEKDSEDYLIAMTKLDYLDKKKDIKLKKFLEKIRQLQKISNKKESIYKYFKLELTQRGNEDVKSPVDKFEKIILDSFGYLTKSQEEKN